MLVTQTDAQYEMGDDDPREWVTYSTEVVLRLELGALLTANRSRNIQPDFDHNRKDQ